MSKGLTVIGTLLVLALLFATGLQAEVYKVVDENGNVTYTDQAPPDGSAPIQLPELSVVTTDYPPQTESGAGDEAADAEAAGEPTPRELRKMFRDFSITRPAQEETIWGTDRPVVVSWGSSAAFQPDMSVRLYVNGKPQAPSQERMAALQMERGEHQVYAELLDARGRRIVVTPTVTFFVKQNAVGVNLPGPTPAPNGGN